MNDDQRRAFLDEVIASPDDDTPRLIYADWLDEAGDPRGEFIRLGCELAALDSLDPRFLDALHRCGQLLQEHREAWARELAQDVRKTDFHRGFIDSITMRARVFIRQGEQLYRATPVNWLRFNYIKGAGGQLAASEVLSKVRRLDLSGLKVPEDDMLALLTSPHLCHLMALKLGAYDSPVVERVGRAMSGMPSADCMEQLEIYAENDCFRGLAAGDGFPHLRDLSIKTHYSDLGLHGIESLRVPRLQALAISVDLDRTDAESLAALPLSQLKKFRLRSWHPPDEVFPILAQHGAFSQVEDLNLAGCLLDSEAAAEIFRGDQLAHCRRLTLGSEYRLQEDSAPIELIRHLCEHDRLSMLERFQISNLDHSDLSRMVRSPNFRNLQSLTLSHSRFEIHDGLALKQSPLRSTLRQLAFRGCEFEDDYDQLASTELPKLLRLDVSGSGDFGITQDSLLKVLSASVFPKLQWLRLQSLNLTDAVLHALASHSNMSELREVDFRHNRASHEAIVVLLGSNNLPRLSRLILSPGEVSSDSKNDFGTRIWIEN